jgi:DNA-binding transcriptional ArsR family regulator
MLNYEIPHNKAVAEFTQTMINDYKVRAKKIKEKFEDILEQVELCNPNAHYYVLEKGLVLEAICSILQLEEITTSSITGSANVPSTILNISQLTGLSQVIVRQHITALINDGLVILNPGKQSTYSLTPEAIEFFR